MLSSLPLVDQAWAFALVFALIVCSLTVLALLGPEFVRDVYQIFARSTEDGPGPTDPNEERRRLDALAADADIRELC